MKYAFFKGCKLPHYLPRYGQTTQQVFSTLGVELIDLDFNCCGHQVRDQDDLSFVFAAVRNIALAEKAGLTIMTPCKCCFGNLASARYRMLNDQSLQKRVLDLLADEGLSWKGDRKPLHLLSVLHDEIGPETLKKHVVREMKEYKIATHYGCHALRPSTIVEFDNPFSPTIFEKLITITGAETVDWARRLECCGNPILEKNRDLSVKMMQNKLEDAKQSGANCICTACTYCQLQFTDVRNEEKMGEGFPESVLFTDILAASFGF